MNTNKDSLSILKEFLVENAITITPEYYLKDSLVTSNDLIELPSDIIIKIIRDAYGSSNGMVREIFEYLQKEYNLFLGRVQKEQLKKYVDYRFDTDFNIFLNLIRQDIKPEINLREICDKLIHDSNVNINSDLPRYLNDLKKAIREKDNDRIQDYLIFVYSRLISLNEKRTMSLRELFIDNEKIIKKELSCEDYIHLKELCSKDEKQDRFYTITKFNLEYLRILDHNGGYNDKSSIIYIDITQELCNTFNKKEELIGYLMSAIKKAYDKLQNHKSLILHIPNVIFNKINIKWELYAYLTIFAEKFSVIPEDKAYYKPEDICRDALEHKYQLTLTDTEFKLIKKYYHNNFKKDYLNSFDKFKSEDIKKTIDYFKNIYAGFTFIDCYVLHVDKDISNSEEIDFIKNQQELLLIFNKHEFDKRKIPCPVCGSLKISGNSYPEVGIKSWECKNPLCSARSKTNRGKRYSARAILMQNATFDFSPENQISKELIKVWRKDVVEKWSYNDLYLMIVKYFSFPEDIITIINPENKNLFEKIITSEKRKCVSLNIKDFLDDDASVESYAQFYDNGLFCDQFLYKTNISLSSKKELSNLYLNDNRLQLILGDSHEILSILKMEKNLVHNMVTSPPYYNAREYSQWKNLYAYLNDMFNIDLNAYDILIDGGVFFYNIGDIFDNENITVKSKMGEKRIPLGAYTILLFEKAGFELLDDVIWYKGEPQTHRHKNDGNYTPYYQRPANCYEHMFIFKKHGKIHLNSDKKENILTQNIIKFTPVFKIGREGKNNYGHTAPFPKKIPLISVLCFTNPHELVLDPFSGSGTSPIVATQNNRIGIGIESNKKYFELSISKAKEEKLNVSHFY